MPSGRFYTIDSGLVTLASTSQTPILAGITTATSTCDILAIRIGVYSGSSVSYPANGTVQCTLARTSAAPTGGAASTANPHNASDIAANTLWKNGSTAITAITTPGVTLWNQILPFTAGANWGEWVPGGAEWRVGASTTIGVALYLTCSSAGTATQFQAELVFVE
jgi:hypothetical protein